MGNSNQEKTASIIAMIVGCAIILMVVLSSYFNQIKELEQQVQTLKDKNKNDSIMIGEYQEAFKILFDKNIRCGQDFSEIMDSLNCN